ncbi:hypothetical protein [Bifidobacterium tsurumiense]|uniref:hypothetical protein n=1 Tax=Bifidobacterium tsurumiense TaxID=356829 RepID=UPI0006860147|nr:hypothetical protein [Bifidobacterium tsurumiense]
MPQTQQVMRGNLAVNPKFFPAGRGEDGVQRRAYLEAVVYRSVPRRDQDGNVQRGSDGSVAYGDPEKVTVKFWGRNAEVLRDLDLRQGDPVVATGTPGQPDAFISQHDGRAYARTVINGSTLQIDAIREAQRREAATSGMERTAGASAALGADPASVADDPWGADASPVR